MKLDDQVCSLELAKKLMDLGVKQKSLFVWEYYSPIAYTVRYIPFATMPDIFNHVKWYSAFTVAELGKMLPPVIKIEGEPYELNFDCGLDPYYELVNGGSGYKFVTDSDAGEADARAQMLIYLIENNLMPAEEKVCA